MTVEHRVYGGPGCGKTTYLTRQIQAAVRKFHHRVLVCSFSNAAANELVTRDIMLPTEQIGTLHSFCRRAIGGGRNIAETVKELDEWNNQYGHGGIGKWHVPKSSFGGEGAGGPGQDVAVWAQYGILRNRMTPKDQWPIAVEQFDEKWRAFKDKYDLIDFTDLIELTYLEDAPCPFDIAVLFADEAQDYSALEMSVVRAWGNAAEYFVLAGDDQQALYSFRGASAEVLLTPELPPDQVTILNQSYRLPSAVLDYATEYGNTMTRFQPKDIQPIAEGGHVAALGMRMKDSERLLALVLRENEAGNSVMILASCDYILGNLVRVMRNRAMLFHNPYRPTYPPWNPCRGGVERLAKFLRPRGEMKWKHVWVWFDHLDIRLCEMQKGAKKLIREQCKEVGEGNRVVTPEDFRMLAGIDLPPPDPAWFFQHILHSKVGLYRYARLVFERYGMERFRDAPQIIVGTFHSVKGGEADVVVMAPDISPGGAREYAEDPDPTRRMMYVGMTRARKKLLLLAASGNGASIPAAGPYTPPVLTEVPF